ncbi:Ferric uptake regulation protein [Methylocella tundrae]|uniref:Ferric uptake regulation protein n=1 Tax=Methylocella tundrae TaxID=227605 RepID=A0A8B6M6W6_METTU|nr:transcriptional repressor [Methylocella tundrae]VTZ28171.1 Ferric uptake regulation protein [Methylocella tundrae]VTZ50159.1 Ferric uptake regulation protein [Methylocella tundrae]
MGDRGDGPLVERSATLKFSSGVLWKRYGLRATRQRRNLAKLLFGREDRHLTAETLAFEARVAHTQTSLATVYNVLNVFARVGLVRALSIDRCPTFFDTNTTDHPHYYFEDTKEIRDIGPDEIKLTDHIRTPEDYEVSRVNVVVTLRPKAPAAEGRQRTT